jgi:hypothetical protein
MFRNYLEDIERERSWRLFGWYEVEQSVKIKMQEKEREEN